MYLNNIDKRLNENLKHSIELSRNQLLLGKLLFLLPTSVLNKAHSPVDTKQLIIESESCKKTQSTVISDS